MVIDISSVVYRTSGQGEETGYERDHHGGPH
ncbi:MAG: hypothetical protein ACI8RZ_007117, partial [Myxococcota bacterium]